MAAEASGSSDELMPVFTIKAKDALAVEAVSAYIRLATERGLRQHAVECTLAMAEIMQWQLDNPQLVREPFHKHVPAVVRG